ncbi:MAG: DNA mismatch repair endonuclease MutL [Promethearchaeia archaeon]
MNLDRRKIKKIEEYEKIAAGEVIERPANVVKELIENSIDANAQEIRLILKEAGKQLIQVIDDGVGIPSNEVELAFARHTSSKIRNIDDLEHLNTLGFRGEALASIAAVSKVEIITRTAEKKNGIQMVIEGGKTKRKGVISCPVGTNIKVKNLFYNLPARRKFLKTNSTELGHISDFVQRYALANPEIHFIYMHNDLDILNCPASNDLKTTVFHIYGKKTAKYMEPINFSEEHGILRVHGLLGHPRIAKKRRRSSSIFLNKRYIISDLLFNAVKEAYKGALMVGKYPFVILFLELEPQIVDFNIHPKKLKVRFENDRFISNRISHVIRNFVEEKFIEQGDEYLETELNQYSSEEEGSRETAQKESIETLNESGNPSSLPTHHTEREGSKLDAEGIAQRKDFGEAHITTREGARDETKQAEKGLKLEKKVQLHLTDHLEDKSLEEISDKETYLRNKYLQFESFPRLRLISSTGQLSNKRYIVLEGINQDGEEGLYLLDQHAASERINKEFFYRQLESSKKQRQTLISPVKIQLSPRNTFFLQENMDEIKKLGFDLEHFGGNTFILRGFPTIYGKVLDETVIREIIEDLTEIGKDQTFSEVEEEIINYLACHRSIRGGDDLSLKDIRRLLIRLAKCKDSYHCAHGRPTLRFFSFKEIDKLFKRTG